MKLKQYKLIGKMKRYKSIINFSIIFLLACLNTTCKKETGNKTVASPPTLIDGIFVYNHNITKFGAFSNSIYIKNEFFSPAVSNIIGVAYADIGTIYANNILLKKDFVSPGSPSYQNDTICAPFPITYSISGGSGFSAATFVDNGTNSPAFTNYNAVPDTIYKSAGLTFTLNNPTNISITKVTINNTDFTSMNNIVTISAAQLSSIQSSTFATVIVNCLNTNNINNALYGGQLINLGSKKFLSTINFTYTKMGVVVKP